MNQQTIDYLAAYIEQLNKITDQEKVRGLSSWHFTTKPDLIRATADLNTSFRLAGDKRLQPHIATTAIGQLSGATVIVSANPGYSPTANLIEDASRSSNKERNEVFCSNFFKEYPGVCGTTSVYWTRVMRFLEIYQEQPRVEPTRAMWTQASDASTLGGLDLLPFHSTKDGITPYLHGRYANPLLREVARASLAMALRLSPKFLLVASRSGHALMNDLLANASGTSPLQHAGITPLPPPPALANRPPYNLIQAWGVNVKGSATTIVSIPYQIFSGAFVAKRVSYRHDEFAAILRALRPGNR